MIENELIIDWFQFTIFPGLNYKDGYKLLYEDLPSKDRIIPILFQELFNISSSDIIMENFGQNGYNVNYSYKDISIMLNSDRDDMGINVKLTGQGCRDYEDLGLTWQELFDKISNYDINFNRIDIAIDTFSNKYYNVELIKKYVINGNCSSKFRCSLEMTRRDTDIGSILGNQIQFGSRASNIQVVFYDKYLERQSAGRIIEDNIKNWYRCELRFRHENALEIFKLINNKEDYSGLIKSVLYNYIDFKEPNSSDKNKSRRPTVGWWLRFLENAGKLQLSVKSSERTISKVYNWLLQSTSRSNLMVYLSQMINIDLDTISTDLIYSYLTNGIEKITDKDIQMINDYRIANKHLPLTKSQINDYIQDIKDHILV